MSFYFRPIHQGHECLQDLPSEVQPDFSKGSAVLEIRNVEIIPQYQIKFF
jgi:beta-galactosidase